MQQDNKLLSNQKANLGDDDCIFRNSIFAKIHLICKCFGRGFSNSPMNKGHGQPIDELKKLTAVNNSS